MHGRSDLAQYRHACRELTNWCVIPQGEIRTRPGTKFVASASDVSTANVLVPFIFNSTQGYVIEMGSGYARFYTNNGQLQDGGVPVSVPTVYSSAELFQIKYDQSGDTLIQTHNGHDPHKVTRQSASVFSFSPVSFFFGPFLDVNASAGVTVSVSSAGSAVGNIVSLFAAGADVFSAGNVSAFFAVGSTTSLVNNVARPGYVQITNVTSGSIASGIIMQPVDASATGGTENWAEGAWSTRRGFPCAVGLFEQRSVFGCTSHQPQTLFGSESGGAIFDFHATTDDDKAYVHTLAEENNQVRWISPFTFMFVGTEGNEYKVAGGNESGITPTNIFARRQSHHGSGDIMPVQVGGDLLFVQSGRKRIRRMVFNLQEDRFIAGDLMKFAEDIVGSGVKQMAYQKEPHSWLWAVTDGGNLLNLAYLPDEQVFAWSEHTTEGSFESVAVIPHPDGDRDQVWLSVKRTVNGVEQRYIEVMDDAVSAIDCAIVYSGVATSALSNLDHLEKFSVVIIGDGAVHPPTTVSGGALGSLVPSVVSAIVGLPFTPTVEPFIPDIETQAGPSAGRRRRVAQVKVSVRNTKGLKINGEVIPARRFSDNLDEAPAARTEIIEKTLSGNWDIPVSITQALPHQATIQAIHQYVAMGDD